MTIRFRSSPIPTGATLLSLLCTASVLPLHGCKDANVEAQVAAAKDLREETRAFVAAAESVTVLNREKKAGEFGSIAGKTSSLGTTATTKSAAGVLSSVMASSAAALYASTTRELELAADRARTLIAAASDSAAMLQTIAEAQSKLSLGDDREFLKKAKAAAEGSLKGLQAKVKELEDPINQLKSSVAARRDKLAQMQQQAADLRREALATNAIAAFPKVEESATIRENAALLRGSIALDESQLFALQPELDHANGALSAAQAISTAADSALAALENFSTQLKSDASGLTKAADDLRASVQAAIDALNAQSTGPLNEAYEKATAMYAKARDDGGRAGATGANETKVTANAALGDLAWQQVVGIDAQIALHQRLAAAGSLFGGEAKQKEAIDALKAKRETLVTAAKESYGAALETIGSMNGESPAVARTRSAIEASVARVEGRAPAPAADAASAAKSRPFGAGAPSGAPTAAAGPLVGVGSGFGSKDDLVAAFLGAGTNMDKGIELAKQGFAFSSDGSRAMFSASMSMVDGIMPMLKAAKEKFGDAALASIGQAAGNSNPLGGAFEKIEQGGKTFMRTNSQGRQVDLELVEINGAWFANGEGLFAGIDPAQLAMAQQAMAAMGPMKAAMKAAADAVAQQIQSGAISSADQVMPAFQQAMMKAMQGGGK
ncbi:MAG: hypothetical protein U0572_17580 [Phycisphaerales bacterium]